MLVPKIDIIFIVTGCYHGKISQTGTEYAYFEALKELLKLYFVFKHHIFLE